MLVTVLERSPAVFCLKGEGAFFEHQTQVDQLAPWKRGRRVSDLIQASGLSKEDVGALNAALRAEVEAPGGPAPSAQSLYARGMAHLASQHGATRWAQKATSYVFHVDAILDAFPQARLVFLARNPLDLAASTNRRNASGAKLLCMVWGWNRGMRLAREHQQAYPERFLLVRYEDLTRQPRAVLERIFDFADLAFDPAYLQVDHVNRSETPYNDASRQCGINASRVFYLARVLLRPRAFGDGRTVRAAAGPSLVARHALPRSAPCPCPLVRSPSSGDGPAAGIGGSASGKRSLAATALPSASRRPSRVGTTRLILHCCHAYARSRGLQRFRAQRAHASTPDIGTDAHVCHPERRRARAGTEEYGKAAALRSEYAPSGKQRRSAARLGDRARRAGEVI